MGPYNDPREGLWMVKISKISLKSTIVFDKILEFFVFVLQCIQRENVNNRKKSSRTINCDWKHCQCTHKVGLTKYKGIDFLPQIQIF